MELQNINDFTVFFSKNKAFSLNKFSDLNNKFKKIFNKILQKTKLQGNRAENQAISLMFYFRALKYLFIIQQITIEGHIEEARILRRNVLELILLGYLVGHSEEVFKLWQDCFNKRIKNTNKNGVVDVPRLRDKKYEVDQIIKKNRHLLEQDSIIKSLIRLRGEFSTYFSHENFYNIVSRIENISMINLGKFEIYVGQSAQSENNRLHKNLMQNLELLKVINRLIK